MKLVKKLIIIALYISAAAFAYGLYSEFSVYQEADNVYDIVEEPTTTLSPTVNHDPSDGTSDEETTPTAPLPTININLDEQKEKFPDLVGWIKSSDEMINYPVVIGPENDYYLYRLANGTPNDLGSIFMDSRLPGGFDEDIWIIYGHNTRNGSMFGSLDKYAEPGYDATNDYFMIKNFDGDYKMDISAAYYVDALSEMFPLEFSETYTQQDYLNEVKNRALFYHDQELGPDDKLVVLVTCAYVFTEARLTIVGVASPVEN